MMIRGLSRISDTIHERHRFVEVPELIEPRQNIPPARPARERLQLTLNCDI